MNRIIISADGPLHFTGELEMTGADGTVNTQLKEAWLCRCGASQNKPHCDGSHHAAQFQDAGQLSVGELGPVRAGAVRMSPRPDGPLKCQGPLEVCDARERAVWRGSETALCRCGASARKPFCDGTHRSIGFKAHA